MSGVAGGSPHIQMTNEGGLAIRLYNKTGATSVKGTIVTPAGSGQDISVAVVPGDAEYPMGIVYESGIPDGSLMLVVVSGVAKVLLKDGEAATAGYWCGVSDTAGRMITANAVPGTPTHNREIGHCLETKSAGTSVLAMVNLHFN